MIKLSNITKNYDNKSIFEDFNLEIASHQVTCILGESGVGKTTLLNMIAKLTPYQGTIDFDGSISYIFQEPRLIPNLTVKKNLKFIAPEATEEQISEILSKLEILDKIDSYPSTLSGGEAQRVSIARAFLMDTPIILMDEPFSSLDLSIKYKLIQYLTILWEETRKTIVFVTHDIDEALLLAHHILILKNGIIAKEYSLENKYPRAFKEKSTLREEIIHHFID